MNILITGGCGYIGRHTSVILAKYGHKLLLYDDLKNSNNNFFHLLKNISDKNISFVNGDIRDVELLRRTLSSENIELVIHFAGLKKSDQNNEEYSNYQTINIDGSFGLFDAMKAVGIKKLIFSSSCAVYGIPQYTPINESHPVIPINQYGQSKLVVENKLTEISDDDNNWSIIAFRHFNVAGTFSSSTDLSNLGSSSGNLISKIMQVISGQVSHLDIWGKDNHTQDGTFIRDYIHVVDVAEAHLAAVNKIDKLIGFHSINIGSGKATSVKQLIDTFELVSGVRIPFRIFSPSLNEVYVSIADVALAKKILKWKPYRSIEEICLSELKNKFN